MMPAKAVSLFMHRTLLQTCSRREFHDPLRGLTGRTAVLSGASYGISFEAARKLGKYGANIVISSRKQENVDQAVTQLKDENISAIGVVCDLSNKDQREELIQDTLQTFGGIDIFVANAAVKANIGPILESSDDKWEAILEVNLKNVFKLTKMVIPHMIKRKGGSIVYVSTIGEYRPADVVPAYSVNKSPLASLCHAVSYKVIPYNIRVNTVTSGLTDTKFFNGITPLVTEDIEKRITMKRTGTVEEIANVIVLLCSDESSYATGESYSVLGHKVDIIQDSKHYDDILEHANYTMQVH